MTVIIHINANDTMNMNMNSDGMMHINSNVYFDVDVSIRIYNGIYIDNNTIIVLV